MKHSHLWNQVNHILTSYTNEDTKSTTTLWRTPHGIIQLCTRSKAPYNKMQSAIVVYSKTTSHRTHVSWFNTRPTSRWRTTFTREWFNPTATAHIDINIKWETNMMEREREREGPILHPAQFTWMNLRALGRFGEKRRRIPAQTFPGAILQFQKNNSATDQEKHSLKSV